MSHRPFTFAAAAFLLAAACPTLAGAKPGAERASIQEAVPAEDTPQPLRRHSHQQRPGSSGYVVNRQGFGNYVPGPNGSFGGYPAGSDGAQELQMNQRYKCQAVPESC